MGQSSSSGRRRRNDHQQQTYPPPPTPPPYPPPYPYPSNPNYANHYAPPPPPHPYSYYQQQQQPTSLTGSILNLLDSLMGRPQYPNQPYYSTNQGTGWWTPPPHPPPLPPPYLSSSAMVAPPPPPPPPPYVEHQEAKTVKNDVNIHKDTIRLERDEQNPDHYLVSFIFDATVDGSIIIYYFAKEADKCSFSPIYVDMYMPIRVPFQKGVGQQFHQPSGSGIDLGFFQLDDLSKPLHGDAFPLVIYAEAGPPPPPTNEQVGQSIAAARAQITQAVIEKNNDGIFRVKVVKQILWIDGERYELREIFGLVNSMEAESSVGNDDDMGKECVICMSEPRNTAVLPCRHMCMCSECAKELRLRSNKCPICRQPVEQLMEIKLNSE